MLFGAMENPILYLNFYVWKVGAHCLENGIKKRTWADIGKGVVREGMVPCADELEHRTSGL